MKRKLRIWFYRELVKAELRLARRTKADIQVKMALLEDTATAAEKHVAIMKRLEDEAA